VDGAREPPHGVGHEPGLPAHLGLAHVAVQLRLRNKRGHRVHHHQVHRAGAHQHVRNVQGLLAVVGLRNEQIVRIDAQALGVAHVQGVLRVHKGASAALLLALCNNV
jgi:hypothetical protein